jgi:phosphoserine phosphatase
VEHIDEGTVERLIRQSLVESEGGRPISARARQSARSVESYLKAGVRPRWMERLSQIDRGIKRERAALELAYRAMRRDLDREAFAQRWRAFAAERDFTALNTLISQHNEWYPIERDLPMDPRTGEYRKILGRSHHRPLLDADWVLAQFPAG